MAARTNRNVEIDGRRTSIALDREFWAAFDVIAAARGIDAAVLASRIATHAGKGRAAAALRVFIAETLIRKRRPHSPS